MKMFYNTVTGISLAHFLPIFFVAPLGEGANFGTGQLCKITLFPMENRKKCRSDFQTCLHPNQDYSETVKDISSEKIRNLENSILHNRPFTKLEPLPQGGHKKFGKKCARLLHVTVISYSLKSDACDCKRAIKQSIAI